MSEEKLTGQEVSLPFDKPDINGTQSADINANAVPRMARHLREFASIRITRKSCKYFFKSF